MHRANQILVNILCGLIVAVVAGIAANTARGQDFSTQIATDRVEPVNVVIEVRDF